MISDPINFMEQIKTAALYIEGFCDDEVPSICIVLGSGLAPLADDVEDVIEIPYSDIPGFPVSTAPGHSGKLLIGRLGGKKVFMMSGRFHYYEGYDTTMCTMYVRVMAYIGVETLYLTNAAGGILSQMKPADLMAIDDHISFMCDSPLRGANLDDFGVRFPDQSFVYDREYLELLDECAQELNINLHRGIYAYTRGPQYETPAEIQMLKAMGAGAVGMSTVPEAIVASHCGMRIVAVSCVTNLAAGISDNILTHEEVIVNAGKASNASCSLAKLFISKI